MNRTEHSIHYFRVRVAEDMARESGEDFDKCLSFLIKNDVFSNWEHDEFYIRPVNIVELIDSLTFENTY